MSQNLALKAPPHNVDAEVSILGSLMLDPDSWDHVQDRILEADFYKPAHQKLYTTIAELKGKNQPIDVLMISNLLQSRGELESIGGSEYLVDILNKTISSANIANYADIVREKSLLRKVIHTSTSIIERAQKSEFSSVESFIDEVESEIFKIGNQKAAGGLVSSMEVVKSSLEKIEELFQRKSDITGVATGFAELDKMTAGMHPGELIIIAARPSMGKTAFSLNIAQHAALRLKKTVAYFSLEMGQDSLMMRILASEAKISMGDIRTGKIPEAAWPKLINAAGSLSEAHIYIDETSGVSPNEVRARCRRLKAKHGLDLIMIDYLQLMQMKTRVESREREVAEMSKTLKAIAKELQVPVIALAQLNRGVESRSDRRPMLSDLRESGSIEQDADVIMMLYREDYYDKENPDAQGNAEVIIAKQRNGPTGNVKLKFEARYSRFKDAEFETPSQSVMPPPPQAIKGPSAGKPKNFAPGAST